MPVANFPVVAPDPHATALRIAIFDLDRTITRIGTYSPFLLFAARRLNPARLAFVPIVVLAMAGYKLRLFSRTRLKEMMQRLMLGEAVQLEMIEDVARAFAARALSHNIYPEAIALIERERKSGAVVVIASAAHQFYLASLSIALGADFAIGTESVVTGRHLRARIRGQNCYGPEKSRRIEAFVSERGYRRAQTHICFYSDDLSDLPAFHFADEAVATNPSRKLARKAEQFGWQVIDWRR